MRNLKKVLSMTLALVMMLGMMTFAGAAEVTKVTSKDLTDMKDVANKEQVSLLVDLGVINGIKQADGTYKYAPAEGINRASFAKMIFTVMMSKGNPDVYKGVATGLSDVKGHWAEGYIAYCVSTKIAAGDNNKKFNPDMPIQTVTAAKMLLTALGYDAKLSKYENDGLWAINIMKDAQAAGLLEGIDLSANDVLSRDAAAQMIFNALFASKVFPVIDRDQGVAYLTKYSTENMNTLGVDSFKLYKVTAPVVGIDSNGKAKLGAVVSTGFSPIDGLSLDKVLPGTPDMVGSTVAIYVKGSVAGGALTVKEIYSTLPAVSASNVLATNYGLKKDDQTSETGDDALTALLVTEKTKVASLDSGKTPATLTYYYNGQTAAYSDSNCDKIGKFGIVTEFKNTKDDAGVDTVVITEKKVATLSAAPVVSGGKVTISSLALANVDAAKVIGYEGLAKDDIVLYVQMGGMTYIEKAAMVEGVVSATHNNKGILLGGTYYLTSELSGKANTWDNDFSNTYNFFLDNGKHIVKAVKVTDKAAASNFGILSNIALVKTDGVDGSHYVEGKIVHTDGTVEKIKIASINGVKVVLDGAAPEASLFIYKDGSTVDPAGATYATGKFYYTKGTDEVHYAAKYFCADKSTALTAAATGMNADKTSNVVPFADLGSFYEYTVNTDGTYALKNTASDNVKYTALVDAVMSNGKAKFNTTDGTNGSIGNSATVFIYETADSNGDPVYTVYKGIANAPTTADHVTNHKDAGGSNANLKTIVTNGAGVATFVYAKVNGTTSEVKDYIYFSDVANYGTVKDGSTTYYTFEAILNGKNATVKVLVKPSSAGLYDCKNVNDKGIYTLTDATTPKLASGTGIKSVAGNSVILGNNFAYTYDSDTVAYYVNGDDVSTSVAPDAVTLNAYDTVYVIDANGDKNAEALYVVHKAPSMTTLTMLTGTATGASVTTGTLVAAGTVTKGAITVTANGQKVQISAAATNDANSEIVRVTINDTEVVVGTSSASDYAITTPTGTGTYDILVKVIVKDLCSGAEDVLTYTVTVTDSIA